MNKQQTIDFVINHFAIYQTLYGDELSNLCNDIREKMLDNLDYVMNNLETIRDRIIEKYNPNLFTLSDYLEHVFHKKFLTIVKNANVVKYVPNYMFYLLAFTCVVKYKLVLTLEKMIEPDQTFKNEHPDAINLLNTRKADNIALINEIHQALLQIDPNCSEASEIQILISNNIKK